MIQFKALWANDVYAFYDDMNKEHPNSWTVLSTCTYSSTVYITYKIG